MVVTGLVCSVNVNAQQLPDGYKKFLGVWNCEPPIGGFGNIKVIEADGKLVVRIKYEGEIITCIRRKHHRTTHIETVEITLQACSSHTHFMIVEIITG